MECQLEVLDVAVAKLGVAKKAGKRAKKPVIFKADIDAVLFDMDGVVTKTAIVHTQAWTETFDAFLKDRSGSKFKPFSNDDYLKYVDGKAREDGITSFLASRKIRLPEGTPSDQAGFDTVYALGRMKNQTFLKLVRSKGIEVYETTVDLIRALKERGFKVAIISASKNTVEVLKACNLSHIFDAKVDGVDAQRLHLPGKPHPDLFLQAAKELKVAPQRAVVVEDAAAGVEAGKRGKFGLVIGVARSGDSTLLKQHGADVVVQDLGEVSIVNGSTAEAPPPGTALTDLDITDENWNLSFTGYDPSTEGRRESLCALGNGYFCTRAANPESQADGLHYPGTYIAGAYNQLKSYAGDRHFDYEEVVNMPNWLCVSFRINNGPWFDLTKVDILSYEQRLNLHEGVLYRNVTWRDQQGRETEMAQRWFVHMRHFHLAAIEMKLTAKNWSGELTIRSAIDGEVENDGTRKDPRLKMKHLKFIERSAHGDKLYLKVVTNQSDIVVAMAARHDLFLGRSKVRPHREYREESGYVAQDMTIEVSEGQSIRMQKTVSLYTSRDRAISEPGLAAQTAVAEAPDFEELIQTQRSYWGHLWEQFDLFIETKEEHSKMQPSLILHLHSFHALQVASPNTIELDCGIPARGWTGEGYQGHIFWDDLFVFPFVNLRMPDITQSLLRYRFRRLPEARKIARSLGAIGARFPWQSGSSGAEETPMYLWIPDKEVWVNDYSRHEVHVDAAIAYNVWQYYQATGNLDFMHACGAELLIEIARFFATFAQYNEKTDRYELHGVVGPDEYHNAYPGADKPGINNNAYTNIMAVWTICRALDLSKIMPADMKDCMFKRLGVTDDELALWERVSKKMYVPLLRNGIINQFDGYDKLKNYPWRKNGRFEKHKLQETLDNNNWVLNDYRVTKQADVLMLFYVFSAKELTEIFHRLGYPFYKDWIAKNVEYYVPRTANASTLSRIAHAWVLSRLDRGRSWRLMNKLYAHKSKREPELGGHPLSWDIFVEALSSDYLDIQGGTTREGIHIGAMAGTLDIVQRCYAGIVTRDDVLWLEPQLPDALTRLSFSLRYRGQALTFVITQKEMKISARHSSAQPIKIGFQKEIHELNAGETLEFALRKTTSKRKPRRSSEAA